MGTKTKADLLREHGLDDELYELEESQPSDGISETIKNSPIPSNIVIPKGWLFKDNSLYQQLFVKVDKEELVEAIDKGIPTEGKKVLKEFLVTYEPIFISEIFENVIDGTEGFTVVWNNGRGWKSLSLSREYFMNSSKILELSANGFPVNSNNAKKIVQYLADFYAYNRFDLEYKRYSDQMGWIKNGFLLGEKFISTDGSEINFLPADRGEKQLAKGFHSKGDIKTWLGIIDRVQAFPKVMAFVYGSFASVVLPIFKVDPHILELSGDTSGGKTISTKISASVWGNPSLQNDGIIKGWNATPVNIERTASLLNHLPLYLDDTKLITRNRSIGNLIYSLASGQGKGRGSVKGSQQTKYWHNITFSTGEQKITSFTKDGGTVGRVLTIQGKPFESTNLETGKLVDDIQEEVQNCYGVAGERWIEYILSQKESWNLWQSVYRGARHEYTQRAKGNSVVGRLAKYMALLHTVAYLFNDCFNTNYDYQPSLLKLWDSIIDENAEVDRPKQALESVISWVNVNENHFITKRERDTSGREKDVVPYTNVWGKWLTGDNLFIYPTELEDFLRKQDYEPTSILKSWKDREWLVLDFDNRLKGRMRLDTRQQRGYIIKNEVITEIMDL